MQHSGITGYGLEARRLWVQSPATQKQAFCVVCRFSPRSSFPYHPSHTCWCNVYLRTSRNVIRTWTHHGRKLGVIGLCNAQDVSCVHYFHGETGQPAGNARSFQKRGGFLCEGQGFKVNLIQQKIHPRICTTLTVKVEEVIMLVDVWPGVGGSSCWAHVLLQTSTLLLAPHLASISADVQGCAAGGTRGVLFQPRPQTWTGKPQIHASSYCSYMYCSLYWLDFTGLSFILRSGLLLLLRLLIAWWLADFIKLFVNITAFRFWEVQ